MTDQQPSHAQGRKSTEKKQKKWSFTPPVMVLLLGVTLIIGYAAGTRNDQIIAAVGPRLGLQVDTSTLDFSSVLTTYRQLKANFDGNLDTSALIQGASKGLVAAAGDVHTEYFTAKEAEEFKNDLTGNIGGGIGAEIGMRDEKPTVVNVLDDTPAKKAGVQDGDILLTVNDESLDNLTVDQVVSKIRGDVDTTVKVTVSRNGDVKNFTITRAEISSPSVTSKMDGEIGILTISRFDEQTGDQARDAATSLKNQGAKKIVLDLRDNGGGYLSAAPDVAGLWLDNKPIVSERKGSETIDEQSSGSNPILAGMPTVVLVNAGTASAAEIVTMALKDYDVATVVGEKTYGKGTVQVMIDLDGGALLKVTVQRWYSPKGTNVDGKGITPDKVVGLNLDDVNANRDPQLEAAKEQLK